LQTTEVKVWDPLVRVAHWLLATAVITAWFVDEPLWLHSWLGYAAIATVLARTVWGFVGSDYARFTSFVRGPRVAFGYFIGLIRFSSKRYLGHTPAGAVMIIALLFMAAVTGVTGMASLAATRGEGPFAGIITKVEPPNAEGNQDLFIEEVHETAANITMVLVLLHIAGVGLASFAHRENLVAAMITGRKRSE
jgi:cytochrome b